MASEEAVQQNKTSQVYRQDRFIENKPSFQQLQQISIVFLGAINMPFHFAVSVLLLMLELLIVNYLAILAGRRYTAY